MTLAVLNPAILGSGHFLLSSCQRVPFSFTFFLVISGFFNVEHGGLDIGRGHEWKLLLVLTFGLILRNSRIGAVSFILDGSGLSLVRGLFTCEPVPETTRGLLRLFSVLSGICTISVIQSTLGKLSLSIVQQESVKTSCGRLAIIPTTFVLSIIFTILIILFDEGIICESILLNHLQRLSLESLMSDDTISIILNFSLIDTCKFSLVHLLLSLSLGIFHGSLNTINSIVDTVSCLMSEIVYLSPNIIEAVLDVIAKVGPPVHVLKLFVCEIIDVNRTIGGLNVECLQSGLGG
jgi:hypothetical protein